MSTNNQSSKNQNNPSLINPLLSTSTSFIQDSLSILKSGDDMDIMSCLINLCEQLSLSSDQTADDPNMAPLLEEICKNLDKTYIIELVIYSLQCINNILDLNPSFTATLRKVGAIPKMIILMSSLEDFSCLESIIKIIEKISFENAHLLLENSAFISLLNVIDFLSTIQKKSVMKACTNMILNTNSYNDYLVYIRPSMEIIASLTKYNESDIQTTKSAIVVFYYIISHMKNGNYIKKNKEIEEDLYKYCFLENLTEILERFFANWNYEEKKIDSEIVNKILKTFEMICNMSNEACKKLLKANVLVVFKDLIDIEFNGNNGKIEIGLNNNQNNVNKIHIINNNSDDNEIYTKTKASFLSELFPLLVTFFPKEPSDEKNNIEREKILSSSFKNEYIYFCNNILVPIVNNIMLKSACSTLSSLLKLLIIFSYSADKEVIIKYLDSKSLSQIISKLLDTKYLPYLVDIIRLLNIIMSKAPEKFISHFIREGIVENLRNFNFIYPNQDENKQQPKNEDEYEDDNKEPKDIIKSEDEGSNKESGSINNTITNTNNNITNTLQIEKKEMSFTNNQNKQDNQIVPPLTEIKNDVEENPNVDPNNNANNTNNEEDKLTEAMKEFFNVQDKFKSFMNKANLKLDELNMLKEQIENSEYEDEEYLNNNTDYNTYTTTPAIKSVENKLKNLLEKYFTDDLINKYLANSQENNEKQLINLKKDLVTLKDELCNSFKSGGEDKQIEIINKILDILTKPENELTLFELESSDILFALCSYFQPNFKELNSRISDEDVNNLKKEATIIPEEMRSINESIFIKTKKFISIFKNDKTKLINYINLLQYTITSMNCFTMLIDDSFNNNLLALFNQTYRDTKKIDVKIKYSEDLYNEVINTKLVNDNIKDTEFIKKLEEYNNAFLLGTKDIRLLISPNSCLDDLNSLLLSNSGVSFISNDKYEVYLIYRVEKIVNNVKSAYDIDSKWKYKNIVDELVNKYNISLKDAKEISVSQYMFGVSFREKTKKNDTEEESQFIKEDEDNNNISNTDSKDNNNLSKNKEITENKQIYEDNLEDSIKISSWNKPVSDIIDNIDQLIFEKFYYNNIIYNKNLYEIKRLMPSLFLLSMIYFPISEFNTLFDIPNEIFNPDEFKNLFINSKVTLLITKASRDGYSISKNSLPSWCTNLSMDFNYLCKFNGRHLLFKVSFDPRRSLINLQNYLKSYQAKISNENQIIVGKSMRLKVIAERDKIIDTAYKVLNDPTTSEFGGYLEFEYKDEIGNGIGPTLEFYSLVIDNVRNDSDLWYKTTDGSLFPKIFNKADKGYIKCLNKFKMIGFIIARALYDDRLIDIPISRVFWDMVLERAIPIKKIKIFDKDLGKVMEDFNMLVIKKKKFIESFKKNDSSINTSNLEDELKKNILYNDKPLEYLDIYFTFPGYNDIELKKDGKNIQLTILNIEEYITLIYNKLFHTGMKEVILYFLKGFQTVLNVDSIKVFNSEEIEESVCGSLESKWDSDILYDNINTEHGIIKDSRLFKDLIKFMCSLGKNEQKQFLTFVTGTSRLPVGGFKSLTPRLTVVKRTCDEYENPDTFLPTVMTCQNYLKLPEYSSFDILKEKFILAMNEGNNEFHLS